MKVSGYAKVKQEASMRQAEPGVWLMGGCHLGLAGRPHHQHRARPAHRQVDLRRFYPHVITRRLWRAHMLQNYDLWPAQSLPRHYIFDVPERPKVIGAACLLSCQ